MADQEVIKHTKKVYKIWNSNTHSFWHKLKEFLIEIIIIVFAVTLSIWLHDNSEHKHQQKEVKEFLLGLRQDLLSDIKEMQTDKQSYIDQGIAFSYLARIKKNQKPNPDSLRAYNQSFSNTTRLQQNDGRFEGFKASGKIGNIEDEDLQNSIMDLYQEDIPSLLMSSDAYIRWKYQFFDFAAKNGRRLTDSTNNVDEVLMADEAQNLSGFLSNPKEIITRYQVCIDRMQGIVKKIEMMYELKK